MTKVPGRRGLRIAVAVALVAAAAVLSTTAAHAATFTVTRADDPAPGTCDPADCSLREAVMAANASPGTDVIGIEEDVYHLTIPSPGEGPFATDASQGDLDVTDPLVISVQFTGLDGPMRPGAGATIDAGGRFSVGAGVSVTSPGIADRVVHVTSSLQADFVTITGGTSEQGAGVLVDGGTLSMQLGRVAGNASTAACCGGGISAVLSTVTLNATDVANNAVTACCGGGIYNESSTVDISNGSDVVDNDAFGCCGGGIYNWTDPSAGRAASLSLSGARITGNDVRDCCGGGLYNEQGGPVTVTITGTTFSDNAASDDCCGGALYSRPSATVTATDTSFSGNTTAGCCGGAIYNEGTFALGRGSITNNSTANCCGGGIATIGAASSTSLTNVTVSGNSGGTEPGQAALPSAGGLYLDTGRMHLEHVTVANNTGSNGASGIANGDVGGTARGSVTMRGSIVAGNSAAPQCLGPISSLGHNIASDASCTLTHATDRPSTNPQLAPLSSGFHALNPGSPAIDAVPTDECPPPATDQRGMVRPQDRADAPGTGCDIGAVEMQGTAATPSPTPAASAPPTPTPTASTSPSASPDPTASPTATPTATPTPTPTPEPIDPRCDDPGVICGTDGSENIRGTGDGELIICGDGDDVVVARGGDDTIECGDEGDTGDKEIRAGRGDDDVDCDGTGDDVVFAGGGDDDVECGAGNDRILGGGGNDRLVSAGGGDRIKGGGGRDRVVGGRGGDRLRGGRGRDWLRGGPGRDGIWGDAGNDLVVGGKGRRDACSGGRGRDTLRGCELVRR